MRVKSADYLTARSTVKEFDAWQKASILEQARKLQTIAQVRNEEQALSRLIRQNGYVMGWA